MTAYEGPPERGEGNRLEPGQSGRFLRETDAQGNVRFRPVDSTSPEALEAQLKAANDRGRRLAENYNRALMDVANADDEIQKLRATQREIAEQGDAYTDQALVQSAKQVAEDLDGWMNWRKVRSEAVANYSREFSQNNVRAEAIREIGQAKERQAQLPRMREEYQALFQKSEEYWEQLQAIEAASVELQDRLAKAMAEEAARTYVTAAPKAPKRGNLWSIFRRLRGDTGVEARRPEYGAQKTEPTEEVRDLLTQIADNNARAETIAQAKTANDVRLRALDDQIREIEHPTVRKAA